MFSFLIIIQILAVCVNTYLLFIERKYCKHLDWWSDGIIWFFLIFNLIPFVGLLTSILGCIDYVRNIEKQLNIKVDEVSGKLKKCSFDSERTERLYETHVNKIKTLSANCITRSFGDGSNSEKVAKECLCNELANSYYHI